MNEQEAQHLRHVLRRYDELSFRLYAARIKLRKLKANGHSALAAAAEKEIIELTDELAELRKDNPTND